MDFINFIKGEIPYENISETLDGIEDEEKRIYEARWSLMYALRSWDRKPASDEEKERFVELTQNMVQRFGPDFFYRTTTGQRGTRWNPHIEQELMNRATSLDLPHYNPFKAVYMEHFEEIQNPPVFMTKSANKEGGYSTGDIESALLITKGDHNAAAQLIINRMKT